MKEFSKYIDAQDKAQLKLELKELYASFELVRDYYQIKLNQGAINEKLLTKYNRQVTKALYFDEYMEGGLDVNQVDGIVKRLNSEATLKYYIEVGLHAVEECTCIANDYGGDFGDDFYLYFEELYEKIVDLIVKKKLVADYIIRLKEIADAAFDGYGHYDQLQDTFKEYINCLLYTSPSPRDLSTSRMPSSA